MSYPKRALPGLNLELSAQAFALDIQQPYKKHSLEDFFCSVIDLKFHAGMTDVAIFNPSECSGRICGLPLGALRLGALPLGSRLLAFWLPALRGRLAFRAFVLVAVSLVRLALLRC